MTQSIEIQLRKKDCCGCSACVYKCPVKCIRMKADRKGFLMPVINKELCVDCGKCADVCPVLHKGKRNKILAMYGGCHQNSEIVAKSSSGGAFSLFAEEILRRGGMVCGAAIGKNYHVQHELINRLELLDNLISSKYVQSDLGAVFMQIASALKHDYPVLFSGTPCQVAGLKNYIGEHFSDNLYTVEFICHGVPSLGIWEEYMKSLEKKCKGELKEINFRSKVRHGWHDFEFHFKDSSSNEYFSSVRDDIYYNGFLENLFLRPSCYQCPFKGKESVADISIADFWGSEKYAPELDEYSNAGLSLITIFSDKGKLYFSECEKDFIGISVGDLDAYISNTASMCPPQKNRMTEKFYRYREKYGTYSALERYGAYTFRKKLVNKIKWKLQK